jgi:glutathione S-transferase
MIIVHHLENSRSQRVLWLLEELGLPYEVKRYERNPKTKLAPLSLKKVHPLGKSPVIEDDGVVIAETGAIVEYLVNKADGILGAPADRTEALRSTHFLHYAEGSLMPIVLMYMIVRMLKFLGWPARKPIRKMVMLHLDWLETEMATRPWFAGDSFTAADVIMSFPVEAARQQPGLDHHPHLVAWLDTIHARPAYQRALTTGGPYSFS